MMSPVKTSSLARAMPTGRGRSQVPPPSTARPILQKSSPNCARSVATMRSQQSARFDPAPTAYPSTIAMVGSGKFTSRSTARLRSPTRTCPSAAVLRWRMFVTSPPAQKWPPAPVRMTTRAAGFASISSSASRSSRRIAKSSALRASGRFRVIVAMAPA